MARREVTEGMRELAQTRAHAYLAAREMGLGDVRDLATYHGRVVRHGGITPEARREALASARMLRSMFMTRTLGAAYVAPRVRAAAPRRSRGRR